jgi:hypothetical protein
MVRGVVSGAVLASFLDPQGEIAARFGILGVQGQHGPQRLISGGPVPAFA